MKYQIQAIIEGGRSWFLSQHNSKNGRYKSWEHCYSVFSTYRGKALTDDEYDYLSLHLAFYLASWGMYRSSSFLFQRDYKVHIPAVKELLKPEYNCLWDIKCAAYLDIKSNSLVKLFELSNVFQDIYIPIRESVYRSLGKAEPESLITDTLITKILMGTSGCVPAFDEYFIKGRKNIINPREYNPESILAISRFYMKHESDFENLRIELSDRGVQYPQMKIIDMCFFQLGQK
jgi:hypothetical protein